MTYYEKKRRKTTLTRSDVANYLNIDYDRYELIERGKVKMPKNLINKFNELINKQKGEVRVEQLNREQIVNEWWDKVRVKKGIGKYGLTEYMDKFNIKSLSQLAELMGYKNKLAIQQHLNGYNNKNTTYDFKNRLYSFFENELNMQPVEIKQTIQRKKVVISESLKWLSHFDIKSYLSENGLTQADLYREADINRSVMSMLLKKLNESAPSDESINKIIAYYDRTPKAHEYFYPSRIINTFGVFEKNDTQVKPMETVVDDMKNKMCMDKNGESSVISRNVDTIINKYNSKINKNLKQCEALNNCIDEYNEKIKELRAKLNTIETENAVYKEFVNDLMA